MRLRAAVVQMHSGADKLANIASAVELVRQAAEAGAQLVVLPELWTYLGPERGNREHAEPVPGPLTRQLSTLARSLHLQLHAGSFLELDQSSGEERVYN